MYRYRAYDLLVASELELPEWTPTDDGQAPDLVVCLGGVPEPLADPVEARVTWAARPGLWRQEVPGVARYSVHGAGAEIRVEPTSGSATDVRAFFHDGALAAALHARGRFVLAGGAAALPGGAVAVIGRAGAGVSTAVAELARRGHPALADHKLVVRFGAGGPEVLPAGPTITLWPQSMAWLGLDPEAFPPARDGRPPRRVPASTGGGEPVPLRAVVVLQRRRDADGAAEADRDGAPRGLRVFPTDPHVATTAVLRTTEQRRILGGLGLAREHFLWAARLAGAVPSVRVVRNPKVRTLEALADFVEEWAAEAAPAAVGA